MNLTVGQLLCLLGLQIWNARIKSRADVCSSAAVNAVANGAAAEKSFAPLIQQFRCRRHGVFGIALSARDGGVTNDSGYRGFKVRRFRTRTEASPNKEN
jgi:hypothetical protein